VPLSPQLAAIPCSDTLISEQSVQSAHTVAAFASVMHSCILQVSAHKIEFYREATQAVVSMEQSKNASRKGSSAAGGVKSDVTLEDSFRDPEPLPEDRTQQSMLKENVTQLLGTLSPREQEVVRLRFGLDDGRARTLEEIGQVFCVTRERVRQIESRALQKLRQPYRNHKLKAYALETEPVPSI
jgi:RNA polymerase sigma factor (sigma-70 family)